MNTVTLQHAEADSLSRSYFTVGNDGVRIGIHYFKYRSLLFTSRKLRDEAIRDLFTALLSMKDTSEYTLKSHEEHKLYDARRQIPYLVRNLTVGNDGVRLGIKETNEFNDSTTRGW